MIGCFKSKVMKFYPLFYLGFLTNTNFMGIPCLINLMGCDTAKFFVNKKNLRLLSVNFSKLLAGQSPTASLADLRPDTLEV